MLSKTCLHDRKVRREISDKKRLREISLYNKGVSGSYLCMPAVLRTGSESRCGGLIGCCRWAAGFFMLRGVAAMSCSGQSSCHAHVNGQLDQV